MDNESSNNIATPLKDQIASRQEGIILNQSNNSAVVVGLGGIGSWIALDAALIGMGILYLFDDDIIEASNLNRTPFRLKDIGRKKTDVMEELIRERRADTIIVKYDRRFTIEDFRNLCYKTTFLFDCSDTTRLKDAMKEIRSETTWSSIYFKLGYDGLEGTISVNDFDTGQWGEDSSYAITPSFVGTPQVISAMVMTMAGTMQITKTTINFSLAYLTEKLGRPKERGGRLEGPYGIARVPDLRPNRLAQWIEGNTNYNIPSEPPTILTPNTDERMEQLRRPMLEEISAQQARGRRLNPDIVAVDYSADVLQTTAPITSTAWTVDEERDLQNDSQNSEDSPEGVTDNGF